MQVSNIITTEHISWKSLKMGSALHNKYEFKSKLHYKLLRKKRNFNKQDLLQAYRYVCTGWSEVAELGYRVKTFENYVKCKLLSALLAKITCYLEPFK